MIAIFSIDGDHTTDEVIDWLYFYQAPYIRIHSADILEGEMNVEVDIGKNVHCLETTKTNDIKIAWLRKNGNYRQSKRFNELHYNEGYYICKYFIDEEKVFKNYLYDAIPKWLCEPHIINLNKLSVLKKANQYGINIPKSTVCNSKKGLKEVLNVWNSKAIIKSIHELPVFTKNELSYFPLTTILTEETIDVLPGHFFPSLIQSYVEKEFEIRSFYLDENFYSVAMFSQADAGTAVDFRNYNYTNPNRKVPFNLPVEIENNLKKLFNDLQLNTGSIDLIKGIDGKYYFLEINPCGQFGMISTSVNYNLEKVVADYLLKKSLL